MDRAVRVRLQSPFLNYCVVFRIVLCAELRLGGIATELVLATNTRRRPRLLFQDRLRPAPSLDAHILQKFFKSPSFSWATQDRRPKHAYLAWARPSDMGRHS